MPSSSLSTSSPKAQHLQIAIITSLLLHALFIAMFWSVSKAYQAPQANLVFSAEIFLPPPAARIQERKKEAPQIVAPPQRSSEMPIEPKRIFESDQDNYSIKEQIRRGDEGSAIEQQNNPSPQNLPSTSTARQESKQEVKTQMQPKPIEKIKSAAEIDNKPLKLKLDNPSMAEITAMQSGATSEQSAEEKLQQSLQAPAQKNEKSSINVGRIGSLDYLSDIPDGEVTLLNTKANKYAVFVRRVAAQVFANLRGAGWQSLDASDIRAIEKDGIFEAILSPKGDLVSVSLTSSSESARFDQVLGLSIKKGAKDPNPPPGAEAEDGRIHFTFQARSWVQIQGSRRTGAPMERRWLLLGTGLE